MSHKPDIAQKRRMSREEWLSRALEVLSQEGGSVLSIDNLVKRLGVSRGSFYWHFKDRTDFVRQVVEYWSIMFTQEIGEEIGKLELDAKEKLLCLMEHIEDEKLTRYDIAIRAWAAKDTVAAGTVAKVDRLRLDFVRSLFEDMGFVGEDLEIRTRIMVVYQSLEDGFFCRLSRKERLIQLKLRHAFLTRP